jgi:hypothetical protein
MANLTWKWNKSRSRWEARFELAGYGARILVAYDGDACVAFNRKRDIPICSTYLVCSVTDPGLVLRAVWRPAPGDKDQVRHTRIRVTNGKLAEGGPVVATLEDAVFM